MLARRHERHIPLLDDPPVGHLQAIVLKTLEGMGEDACGYNVLEKLTIDNGVWIEPSQIYSSIRKLLVKELIVHTETRSQPSGAPLKFYKLTAAGRAALEATAAHHTAVADYLLSSGDC